MARGKNIVVSGNPRGVFKEGVISGTPKPGTFMTIKWNTALVGSKFTWEAFNPASVVGGPYPVGGSDGAPRLVTVLREDDLQGSDQNTAYVSGARGYLYCPAPGEELNGLVADIAGTSSASEQLIIGELMVIQAVTGKLVNANLVQSPQALAFTVLEATVLSSDFTADTLAWVMRN